MIAVLIASGTSLYVLGVIGTLVAGIAFYADARHYAPNDSRSDKTAALRLVRGCLIWPLLALGALMPTLSDILHDLHHKGEQ